MNQSFYEDQHIMMPSQLENFRFQTNLTYLESIITPTSLAADFCLVQPSMETNEGKDFTAEIIRESKIHRSSTTYWACGDLSDCIGTKRSGGDHDNFGVSSATKMKKINMKTRRKVRDPRFCFKTMSDVDVLDDGYKWRKYGQKVVKNTDHPRSYYRCTQENCRVKKRVERLAEDPRMVITTYEGRHIHSPSHDNDDQDSHQVSPQFNNFFW